MAAYTIVLEGTAGVVTVTPKFNFPGGDTIAVDVGGVFVENLISGIEASINLNPGQSLEYICSDWDAITKIDIRNDKVSGDVSGWTLPNSLVDLYFQNVSASGDVSGWVLPNNLVNLHAYATLISGDISGWVLPSNLVNLVIFSTPLSGDISGWILPNNLVDFRISITSLSGDISGWTLPNSLVDLYLQTTSIDYDSFSGAFIDITDNLTKIDFDNCNLTQSQVDNILADLVASGIDTSSSAKTIEVGLNNSGPSIIGCSKKLMLEARGWTVKINAIVSTGLLELSRTGHSFSSRQEM